MLQMELLATSMLTTYTKALIFKGTEHHQDPRPSMVLEITSRLCPPLGTPGVHQQLCYGARQADSPRFGVNLLTAGRKGTVPANTLSPTEDTNSEDLHHVNESNYKLFNKERGAETLFRF